MFEILKRYNLFFVFIFAVSIVSFNGSFDSGDQDYLDAQNNLNNTTDATVTYTNPVNIRDIQLQNIDPTSGTFSLLDTLAVLAPGVPNNGGSTGWGMFLNLVAGSSDLKVVQMSTASTAAANANFTVEVFTRSGTALGGPVGSGPGSSTAGWTSLGVVPVTQGPVANDISLLFNIPPINIHALDTTGVALVFTGAGPRYLGSGSPPLSVFSDANLTLITGDGRSAPFTTTGSFFSSRAMTGQVRYVLNTPVNCSYTWGTQTSGTANLLQAVWAPSANVCWIAGAAATVRRTTDGGTTWTNGNPNPGVITGDVYNIWALDANTALLTTSPAATFIYRTTNGGTNWTQVFTQAGGFIDAIVMANATTGYAYGDPVNSRWSLWKTTDGGATWDSTGMYLPVTGSEAGWNNSMCVIGNNIWFGTNNTKVYHSTNAGLTGSWVGNVTTGNASTYGVWFTSATNGICVGTIVQTTTNGGTTWVNGGTVAGTGNMTSVGGSGSNWWLTRGNNTYGSTDFGATWTGAGFTGTQALWATSITSGPSCLTGWSVGAAGTLLKLNGAPVGVQDPTSQIPNSYKLEQNYPNPFNPVTNITFALPVAGNVELKIFDITGKEVSTLVNSFTTAGTHVVPFNASSLASGVYIYKITAGSFTASKKMVLIK